MQASQDIFCVLLVEDQPITLENMKAELEDESFRVFAAENALEARHILDECGECIGAAFLDIDLGPGEDGFGLARYARSVKPDLRIVYTSGGARAPCCMSGSTAASSWPSPTARTKWAPC